MGVIQWKITTEGKPRISFSWLKWLLLFVVIILVLIVKIDRKDPFYSRTISIVESSGEVLCRKGNDMWKPLSRGMVLQEGDSIRTVDGSAMLRLWNGSQIYLEDNSWLKINSFNSDSWIDRSISAEVVIGDVYFDVEELVNGISAFEVVVDSKLLDVNDAQFAVSLDESGAFALYSHDSYLQLGQEWISPGQLYGFQEGISADVASALFVDMHSQLHDFMHSRIDQTIRVMHGDLLYPAKQFYSFFVSTLLLDDSHVESFDYAVMEELWMEAIALSLDGRMQDAHDAVIAARKKIMDIKYERSYEVDSYKELFMLSSRLEKLYELSAFFPESHSISSQLLLEISHIRLQDAPLFASAYFRQIEDLYAMDYQSTLFQKYTIDLAQTLQQIRGDYNDLLRAELESSFSVFVSDFENRIPGLAKLYSTFILQ